MEEFLKRLKVAFICTGITVVWSVKIIVGLIKRLPVILKSCLIVILLRIARITNNKYLLGVALKESKKFLEKDF